MPIHSRADERGGKGITKFGLIEGEMKYQVLSAKGEKF